MKNAFIIFGITLSAIAGMTVQAMAFNSNDTILKNLFDAAGVNMVYSNDAKELSNLSNDDAPFEHLYLFMYQNVKEGPRNAAFERLAKDTDYNAKQLEAIVLDEDLDPILNKRSEEYGLVRSEYVEEFSYLQGLFVDELEFQTENRKLVYQSYANELFFNGKLGDSADVDLLHDLDIIHTIIFNEPISYPDRGGAQGVELASSPEPQVILAAEQEAEEFDPLVCREDESLSDALEVFEAYVAELPIEIGGGDLSEDGFSIGSIYAPAPDGDEDNDGLPDIFEEESIDLADLDDLVDSLNDTKVNFDFQLPCDEIFCITIDLITGTKGGGEVGSANRNFGKKENCIACHIKFINELFDETLGKSLAPGRVSTNNFEDASCKDAGKKINLGLHVYTIPMVVDLDSGQALNERAKEQSEKVKEELQQQGAYPVEGQTKTRTETELESYVNLQAASGSPETFAEGIAAQASIVEAIFAEEQAAYDSSVFDSQIQDVNVLFANMSAELGAMRIYFNNFNQWLSDTYATGNAPLDSLLNDKQDCQ